MKTVTVTKCMGLVKMCYFCAVVLTDRYEGKIKFTDSLSVRLHQHAPKCFAGTNECTRTEAHFVMRKCIGSLKRSVQIVDVKYSTLFSCL
jgi:hypothetical protein